MFCIFLDTDQTATALAAMPRLVDWGNVVSGSIGGIVAVILTLIAEFLIRRYERRVEKAENQVVHFKNEERKITGSVFTYLGPDASVEMMKNDLGPPNREYGTDAGLFDLSDTKYAPAFEDDIPEPTEVYVPEFIAYLYFFQNAFVKVISRDGKSIIALTVIPNDESVAMPFSEKEYLNRYKLETTFFEDTEILAEHMPGCRDTVTAICSLHYAAGKSTVTTFFCEAADDLDLSNADLRKHPRLLIGSKITGICLSTSINDVSYIYLSELY